MAKNKLILFLAILIFIASLAVAQSQEPSPTPLKISQNNQNESTKNKQASNNYHNLPDNRVISVDNHISSPIPQSQANKTTNNGNNDTSTNRGIMIATIVIAICAAIQAYAIIRQYAAMREQVEELRKSVNATQKTADAAQKSAEVLPLVERAYVFAKVEGFVGKDVEPIYGDRGFTGNFIITANIVLSNHGKTPAVISGVSVLFSPQSPQIPKLEKHKIPSSGLVLGSDKLHIFCVKTFEITEKILNKYGSQDQDIRLFCCGVVEYKDIFKDEIHSHGFCWEYKPPRTMGENSWVISIDYKMLNYYT